MWPRIQQSQKQMQVKQSNLNSIIKKLSITGKYGLDTETTGLRFRDRLFSVIISDGGQSYYFNYQWYEGLDSDLILPRETLRWLQPIFSNSESLFYISNAKFDLSMLRRDGLEVHGTVVCTNALGRVLRNNHFDGYSLAKSAARIGLEKDSKVEEYIKKNKLYTREDTPGKKTEFRNLDFTKVPYEIMSKYAEMDAELHYKVGVYIQEGIDAPNSLGAPPLTAVAENEILLTRVCFDMEWTGIKINRAYIQGALEYENTRLCAAKEVFRKEADVEFSDSNKFLAEVFTRKGFDFPKTEKGNPSFTDAVLEDIDSSLAESIRTIRHHEKRIGTYYSSFIFYADANSVVHPNMRQGGTETGRFSYSDPNLQNVPKEDSDSDKLEPYTVRGCFVPREDFAFVSIDYSQQEFRLMLDYAGEKALIREIMNGADVHQATADLVGISRKQAKALNFACIYGAGAEKLGKMIGVSTVEARKFKELYFEKLPKVENFIAQVSNRGRARGFIWNWAGRRCYIANREWAYILPNHLIQGGCADIIKFSMVKIAKFLAGKISRMLLNVHDELLFEVHKSELHIVPDLRRLMEETYVPRNGLYLSCTVEHSWKSWGAPDKIKGGPE